MSTDAIATAKGECRRAKQRAHELGVILTVLGESVPTALDTTTDVISMAVRLQGIVQAGAATLNDLAQVAGRLAAIGAVQRDL